MNAIDSIKSEYSLDDFKNFASHGCASSCPNNHWNYHQTKEFYIEHEDEILQLLDDINGEPTLRLYSIRSESITELMNIIVWAFIETVSIQFIAEYEEDNETN